MQNTKTVFTKQPGTTLQKLKNGRQVVNAEVCHKHKDTTTYSPHSDTHVAPLFTPSSSLCSRLPAINFCLSIVLHAVHAINIYCHSAPTNCLFPCI